MIKSRQAEWARDVRDEPLFEALAVEQVSAVCACHFLVELEVVETDGALLGVASRLEVDPRVAELLPALLLEAAQVEAEDDAHEEYDRAHDEQRPRRVAHDVHVHDVDRRPVLG